MHEFVEYMSLLAQSENIWAKAKTIMTGQALNLRENRCIPKKYIVYIETPKLKGYDVLLDEY